MHKSKWIKDLNMCSSGTGNHFLNITPSSQTLRETNNKWDLLKLKSFCKANDTVNKTKRQPTEWEKIFTNPTSEVWSPKYTRNSKNWTPKDHIIQWKKDLNRELSIEESKMAERHLRKCSISLAIREMEIKTTLRFHLLRMAQIKNTDDNLCWRGCGEKGTLLHCWWECKLVQPLWMSVCRFLRKLRNNLPQDSAIPLLGIYPKDA